MRPVPMLAWRLLRGSGRRGALTTGLSTLAVAVATALLLLTIGVALGFSERAERESWLNPQPATGSPTALMAVSTDFVRGEPIAVVRLAALSDDAPELPGMRYFPNPGEVLLSPALADLASELPADQLRNRFDNVQTGRRIAGHLGDAALTYPDQLVAVIGQEEQVFEETSDPFAWTSPYHAQPTPITDFNGQSPHWALGYEALSAYATALLVVPLFVLGTAAGRLSTAQRDRRLAAMRLVGATPAQVVAVTTFETVLIGIAGALLGAGIYVLTLPLAAQVSASGGTWFISDLWVGLGVLGLALVAVPLIVAASALVGLRALVISPLGVARRQKNRRATFWRLILFILLIVGYFRTAQNVEVNTAIIFALFFGILFLGISLVGPFIVRLLGYTMTLVARKPATLLAGRRIIDDPFSVWRIVGGVVLTGFVAGILTILIPMNATVRTQPSNWLSLHVEESVADQTMLTIQETFEAHGIPAEFIGSRETLGMHDDDEVVFRPISVNVHGDGAVLDQARTLLIGIPSLTQPATEGDTGWRRTLELNDIRTASILVLTVTLAVATVSAAIMGVTSILDRRQTLGLLRLAGTPLSVLNGARLRETLVPFLILGGGAIAIGIICALPLAIVAEAEEGVTADHRSYALLLIPVIVATLGLILTEVTSRWTMRSATSDPTAHR